MHIYKKVAIEGLPRKYTFEKLLYNQVTKMIIAQIKLHLSKFYISRIYYRHIREDRYHKIGCNEKENYSYDSMITSICSPKIYFNVIGQKISKGDISGNWIEMRSYDLITKRTRPIFTASNFVLKEKEKRAWITNLVGVTPKEDSIFCIAGFESRVDNMGYVDYYLCKLIVKPLRLERLTLLRGVFL